MAVAGGSEGSGQAAFTGYHHSVDRVLMFSGMVDAIEYDLRAGNYTAAPYIVDGKGKTPHSRCSCATRRAPTASIVQAYCVTRRPAICALRGYG